MKITEEEEAKTSVWWNMDACEIPKWCDAGRIRDCIKGALEKLGNSGPVSINAYGNLNQIPGHVLRGLSSTGITVHHKTKNAFLSLTWDFFCWKHGTKPPATMMVIAGISELDSMFNPYSAVPTNPEFKFVLVSAMGPAAACGTYMLQRQAQGLFGVDVLEDARISDDKQACETSESGESAFLLCRLCDFSSQSVESFTMHLSSEEHLQMDYSFGFVQASHDSHPKKKLKKRKRKRKRKRKKTATTVVDKKPKTLVDANKFKKNLRKRKRKKKTE